MNPNTPRVTPERILQMAWGYAPPLILEAALHHRVFDILDAGPQTVEAISRENGASERGLRAIMDAIVGLNLLAKDGEGRYSLTPESATFLVSSKPSFCGGLLRHVSTQLLPTWLSLNEVVQTGLPPQRVNDEGRGAEFFQQFVEDIAALSYPAGRVLAESLQLAAASAPVYVLDIASGSGVWGIALAQASPQVQVTALDWMGVLPVTRRVAERFGLQGQFGYIEGDLREVPFGNGYHVATLGHILHSEGEQQSRALLTKVFDSLAPGGTVAIAEFLTNEARTGPPQSLIFAVNMLVNTEHGDTFSFEQISGWLREIGFENARTLEAPGPAPLVLADKPMS